MTILIISMANPNGFLIIIETIISFNVNIIGGVFISIMIIVARKKENFVKVDPKIFNHINEYFTFFAGVICICFFSFALFFDVLRAFLKIFVYPLPF
jgi:hypothetical protein